MACCKLHCSVNYVCKTLCCLKNIHKAINEYPLCSVGFNEVGNFFFHSTERSKKKCRAEK